jgi:hypothetical protein
MILVLFPERCKGVIRQHCVTFGTNFPTELGLVLVKNSWKIITYEYFMNVCGRDVGNDGGLYVIIVHNSMKNLCYKYIECLS